VCRFFTWSFHFEFYNGFIRSVKLNFLSDSDIHSIPLSGAVSRMAKKALPLRPVSDFPQKK
jgi:hypothetical protein